MATTIITKNSSTASDVPTTSDLVQGELAVNVTDKRLFTENASTQIVELGTNPSSITTANITATGTVTANSNLSSSNAVLTGGTVNGIVIGGSSATTITGTTITANSGFSGTLTGNVVGNVTGNLTGVVTGSLNGNVTASSGTTTLNNLVLNGTVDFNAAELTDLATPTAASSAATKGYVDTEVAGLVDSAPGTLDTLNELAAALGDDPDFATTITNQIATKLALAGGTMTGAIAMGTNKITGLGTPTASADAVNKTYADTMLPLAGGTMTGNIVLGSNKATSTATPSAADDLTRKGYVDGILGSATSAATSAATATTKASEASTSASNAASSATSAASSATSAAASYDSFDDRYLGAKSSSPSVDNDGAALLTGALYWDTTAEEMRVYTGTGWTAAGSAVNGTSNRQVYTATSSQTTFSITYDVGYVDVYLNGSKLKVGTDFTATSGTNIVLAAGAATGDILDIVAYGAFNVANTYTQAAANAKFAQVSNNLSDLASAPTALTNLGLTATAAEVNLLDGSSAGTIVNSKGVVYGSSGEVNATTLQLAGTSISSTAAELNLLDALSRGSLIYGNSSAATAILTKGSAGTVLTSDGTDISWAAPSGGGNELEFTASGAVASGKPVILNANGTVTQVAETTITEALGTEATFNSNGTEDVAAVFDSNAGKTVIAYQDQSDTNGKARVCTIASDGDLTYGTVVTFHSGATRNIACSYDSTANKVLIVYADQGDSDKIKARVGTVSGTGISFGTETEVYNQSGQGTGAYIKVEYSPDDDRHFVIFRDSSNYLKGLILQVSGTGVSNVNGSSSALNMRADGGAQGSQQKADICYDTSADVFVVAFADPANSNYGTVVTANISGNSATISSKVVFNSANSYECVIEYSAANNKFIVGYKDIGNNSYPTTRVGSVSGTTASFGGSEQVVASVNSEHYGSTYDTNADRFIILYRNETVEGGNYAVGTLSGDSISFATPVAFNAAQTTYMAGAFDSSAEKVLIAYRDHGNFNYGNARALTTGHVATNVTSSNFVGIAKAAISDGAQGDVVLQSGVITNSNFGLTLTVGSTYFVQRDGTYGTTAASPSVEAGKALTATTLLLKGI